MKKSNQLIFLLLLLYFTICPNDCHSRIFLEKDHSFSMNTINDSVETRIKGKLIITAGVGLNLWGRALQKTYLKSSNYSFIGNIESHRASAMYNTIVDYGISKKISIGAAFGYQKAIINLMHLDNTEDKYFDSWTRLHLALRGDYFIKSKENFDLYSGISICYNKYTVTSNVPDSLYPQYLDNLGVRPSLMTFQGHAGFHYYIKKIGFNAEVGFGYGAPAIGAFGLTLIF